MLVKDQQSPPDIRLAIALEFSPDGGSRSVIAKSSAGKQQRGKLASERLLPSRTAKLTSLEMLLSIARDTNACPIQRRKASAEAARHLLPMKPAPKRWWNNAPIDEYGFAITPQIAAEYRDITLNLRSLRRSRANTSPKKAILRRRLEEITHRLQCPCPSQYGRDHWLEDGNRIVEFLRKRADNQSFSDSEDAEEAHCTARFDCFNAGPESGARERLNLLLDKERAFRNAFGPPLTWKEQVDLRLLRLLYSQRRSTMPDLDDKFGYHPLRDAPFATDGNLYPPHSKLAPLKEGAIGDIIDLPPFVVGDPNRPGHRWYWSPPI